MTGDRPSFHTTQHMYNRLSAEADAVLSEVHLGTPPAATHWRTTFRVHPAFHHAALPGLLRTASPLHQPKVLSHTMLALVC